MEFAGIITEYDPFHNGHAEQIRMLRAKGAKRIAVCMSDGATQRGSIPLLPSRVRVEAALSAGADLVLGMPAPYACLGAEGFAAAGVSQLTALGCDTLAFGAETPDAELLMQAAELVDSPDLSLRLPGLMGQGMTFAAARAAAAEQLVPGMGTFLEKPNNILGVEYCKAIRRQGSHMQPFPLPRVGAGHNTDETGEILGRKIASASKLRQLTAEGASAIAAIEDYVPARAALLYREAAARGELSDRQKFSIAILSRLRGRRPEELARLRGLSEGIENRLYTAIQKAEDVEMLYTLLKTRRYPHARIRRLVLDAAMNVTAQSVPEQPPWLHVLGARRSALGALRYAALPASTSLAELSRLSQESAQLCRLHSEFVDFSALCRVRIMPAGLAYTAKPVVL